LETIGCPETSVRNFHYLPRNNPEERSYQELKMLLELKPNFVRGFGGSRNMEERIKIYRMIQKDGLN